MAKTSEPRERWQGRCADGEVLDRLHAVEVARAAGIHNEPAAEQLRRWARWHAQADHYAASLRGEP
jgi:hypothetical protein